MRQHRNRLFERHDALAVGAKASDRDFAFFGFTHTDHQQMRHLSDAMLAHLIIDLLVARVGVDAQLRGRMQQERRDPRCIDRIGRVGVAAEQAAAADEQEPVADGSEREQRLLLRVHDERLPRLRDRERRAAAELDVDVGAAGEANELRRRARWPLRGRLSVWNGVTVVLLIG